MSKLSNTISHVKAAIRTPRSYFTTFGSGKLTNDLKRWQSSENLDPDWDERTALIANIVPVGLNVIEFGAARLVLRQHLDPSCKYQPADLVKRSEDTLVFDLNGALPELPCRYDVAVFSGVLEYVHNLERIMAWLPSVAQRVIFSYGVTDFLSDPITRRQNGWVNHLSEKEITRLANKAELELETNTRWRQQVIFSGYFLEKQAGMDRKAL